MSAMKHRKDGGNPGHQTTSNLVNIMLAKVPQVDRKEVYHMLVELGMFYYFQETQSTNIHMDALQRLYETHRPNPRKPGVPLQNQPSMGNTDTDRHGRQNAMIHYPFADNIGSVDRVLSNSESTAANPILRMSSPARKRWANQVFDEMCIGRTRMRIADIPEALKSLQLTVTSDLSKALKKHSTQPVPSTERGSSEVIIDATIDADQWYAVVKRCIRREQIMIMTKQKEDEELLDKGFVETKQDVELDSASVGTTESYPSLLDGIASNRQLAELDEIEDGGLTEHQIRMKQDRRERQHQQREKIRSDRKLYQQDKVRKDRAALAAVGARRVSALTASSIANSRSNPGQSSELERAWREPLFASSQKRSTSDRGNVVNSLSRARSASIGRTKQPLGRWADLDSGTATLEIAESFLLGPVGRELTDPSSFMSKPTFLASNELNDLHGDEYERDIVEVVDAIESSRQREVEHSARSQADYLLHGLSEKGQPNNNWSTSASHLRSRGNAAYAFNDSRSSKDSLGLDHKTVRQRESEQSQVRESRALYSQGWRSAKGGWVADFGPPHTHALNRDEDLDNMSSLAQMRNSYYRRLNENKRFVGTGTNDGISVSGVDDFTMDIANTLHRPDDSGVRTRSDPKPYPYSRTRLPDERLAALNSEFGLTAHNSDIEDIAQRQRLIRVHGGKAGASTSSAKVNSDQESSVEDVPIHAYGGLARAHSTSSGKGGARVDLDDDQSGDSNEEKERLLSSLQDSMSLKAAAAVMT